MSQQSEFIDHHGLSWRDVNRVRCQFYHRFHYEYPGPIHDLKQRLVVIPADQYGTQQLRKHELSINPTPISTRQATDHFGNRVLEFEIPTAEHSVSFEVLLEIENLARPVHRPAISASEHAYFLQPSTLTTPNRQIKNIARELQQEAYTPHELAQSINDYVYSVMQYAANVTTVETTASEALEIEHGLCQDYSHVMLAICRAAGLASRYVSGHLLGEGGSHAWVEVLLPDDNGLSAFAFDPTNNRVPHLGYITVAVGRDYHDVSPTSGSFSAPYGGQLTCSKRAGLTLVEFTNGNILEIPCSPLVQ
ncbi:MAG: transglutaminase family protein [Anaerolineae bacterium]|nr:transglutaminase family protein [Anaerolineae bacterium]